MTVRRFQVSTRRTGRKRIVKVEVHDTESEMQAAAQRHARRQGQSDVDALANAGAVCQFPREWWDNDERTHLVTIRLSREQLDLTTIMHESVHAAMFLYAVDFVHDHSRARAHVNGWNEPMAYLASDIYSAIIWKFDVVPIGEPAPLAAEG